MCTPAHNGETPLDQQVVEGQCRGKSSAAQRHDPVTTDPSGERPRTLSHPVRTVRCVANLWTRQYAGSRQGLTDLPSYISGYVDGGMLHGLDLSPTDSPRRMGGEAELVGQPKRRP
jgi:hypothetical protein